MQQLGAAARFGPVGEIIRLQTTLTYSARGVAGFCRHDGDSMKNRGESVEARACRIAYGAEEKRASPNTRA